MLLDLPACYSKISTFDLLNLREPIGALERTFSKLILNGYVPDELRKFVPIVIKDKENELKLWVTRDYLSVKTDTEIVRTPMSPVVAQELCDQLNCSLPTTKISTEIWKSATKLEPLPWGPPYDHTMYSIERIVEHSRRINEQAKQITSEVSFLAGHKKDVVVTSRLNTQPEQVAIFGWHRASGKPIQPLYLGHENTYYDYSHGIRLVSNIVELNGSATTLHNVMSDDNLFKMITDEHVKHQLRYHL